MESLREIADANKRASAPARQLCATTLTSPHFQLREAARSRHKTKNQQNPLDSAAPFIDALPPL
jgi:hypothetical protein